MCLVEEVIKDEDHIARSNESEARAVKRQYAEDLYLSLSTLNPILLRP